MSVNAVNNTTANVYTSSQVNTADKKVDEKSSQNLKVQELYIKNQERIKRQLIQ